MTKRPEELGKLETEHTSIFVKNNWPLALVITGTAVGAAIWLTARYLRKRKERDQQVDRNLEQIELEAGLNIHPNVMLLEGGSLLAHIAGDEVAEVTSELGIHIEHEAGREAIQTLGRIAANDTRK